MAVVAASTASVNAGIFDLQPAVTTLTQTYQHTYTHTDLVGDPNVILRGTSAVHVGSGTMESFYYSVNSGNVGHVIYNFRFSPPTDKPNAVVTGISVTSHSNDFGNGFANGTFWTDAMTTPVEFFRTNDGVNPNDGNAVVTKSLGNFASVDGARSVQLVYTADLGGQGNSFQQLLGAHDQATPSWTFDVTATWADSTSVFTPIAVANHSFELEPLGDGGWADRDTALNSGWTYGNPTGDFQVHDPAGNRFAGAGGDNGNSQNVIPHGGQILNLSAQGVSQIVGSTDATTEYLLSFWIGTAADSPFDVPGTFTAQLLDNGVPFADLSGDAPLPGTFKEFTLSGVTGSAVLGNLSINFLNTGGTVWLDNVQLFSQPLAAVPEPKSIVTWMLVGLGALWVMHRRRVPLVK